MDDKKPVSEFIELLKNHCGYLHKYQEEIIKPLSYFTYPSRNLIFFFEKQLIPKLENRGKKSDKFSDLLMWNIHKLVSLCNEIQKFIQGLSQFDRNAKINAIKQDLPDQCTTESMLRVPLTFLSETIPNSIQSTIKFWESKQQNEEKQDGQFKKQADALKKFIKLYENFIKHYVKSTIPNQQIEGQVLSKLYKDISNNERKAVKKFVFKMVFMCKLKQKAKKAEKRLKDRKMRFQQLVDGERKYVQGLQQYINFIKKPIEALNILSTDENMKLFSTIQSILGFHDHFEKQLKIKFDKYDKYQTFGDVFLKNIPYFKIYTDYILYADEAEKIMLNLQEQHEEVEEICSQFMLKKQKKASDELKQPTFRIARYDMILTEVLKKTNPDHPDYILLSKAQASFVASLKKINETVDSTFRRNRLNQLQQQFGTQQRPIYVQHRQFMEQFNLFLIREEKMQPVEVFIFSDFVMVIDDNRKVIKWIQIDQNFYVRREEDSKIYRNIIKIHSDGFLTFSSGNQDKNFNKAEQFYELLSRVSKENQVLNRMVYVQVIGTEQIGSTSFAKHTEYIVELKFMGLRKFIHLRFSQMKPFLNKIQNHFKNDLNITEEEALKKNWFNNHKSKTIEDRKRTIEQILQKILNHQMVKNKPQFVLNQLGIDANFLKIGESPEKKRQTIIANHSKIAQPIPSSSRAKKKQLKEAETILCATEIKLGRDMLHDPEETFLEKKKIQSEKIEIYIKTTVDQEPICVKINEYFTVQDVCYKVSKIIGLRMNRDFRLFHEIGKKQLRVLDPEQKIMKIFSFPKKEVQQANMVTQFFGSIKRIIAPDTHPTLIYKKYYFLPMEIQQYQSKKDLTRLRLLVYQIFSQIKEMKYQLSFDEYLLFLAMMIYIEFDGEIPEDPDEVFVNRLIPETIFKLKNYTEQQWLNKCKPHALRLSQQINKIIDYNRQQLKNKKIKADTVSKTALYFGHRHLCSQIVINKIKHNPIYGSNLFYVQPYKSTYDKLIKQDRKMAYNMWLAIKVESLNLLTPSSKQTVLQLHYKDIEKIFVYSEAIIFKMDGLISTEYRLNTYQSFQISQLVKYNKALNDTLLQLGRDEDLIAKARSYKQQLLIYRNTHDQSQVKQQVIS